MQAELGAPAGDHGPEPVGVAPDLVDQLQPDEETAPADVADHLVAGRQLVQPAAQAVPELAGAQVEPVPAEHVEHRVPDGGGQRVVAVRGEEEEAALVGPLLDLGAGQHRGER